MPCFAALLGVSCPARPTAGGDGETTAGSGFILGCRKRESPPKLVSCSSSVDEQRYKSSVAVAGGAVHQRHRREESYEPYHLSQQHMAALPPVVVLDVDASQPVDQPIYLRNPPWRLLLSDLKLIIAESPLLWVVLSPLPAIGTDLTWTGVFAQVILVAVSILLTIAIFASFAFGFPTPSIVTLATYLWIQLSNWLQGREVLHSKNEKSSGAEEWLFVNGVATSPSGTKLIIDALEELFHRPITAIHNRTQGIWFDLIECMVQRDLLWPTDDARRGYEVLSAAIRDDTKKRVVLISHSQGGIILSGWIDQLLDDFSAAQLAKVEVYTFASAANHFSAPSAVAFNRIEHFANDGDFVSRIGILNPDFAPFFDIPWQKGPVSTLPGRYAGRIFKRKDVTGHLMLSHYLAPGNSFLDHPAVVANSQLCSYLGGSNRVE